jgi:hypothetical protein
MKASHEEFKRFIDSLSDDWYLDICNDHVHSIIDTIIEGKTLGAIADIGKDQAVICWQGDGEPPISDGFWGLDFITEFRKWKRAQTTSVLVIEVDTIDRPHVVKELRKMGGVRILPGTR